MPPQRAGTGFVNLNRYLGLNQGSGAQMGNALASDVEAKGQDWTNRLNQGVADFRFAADSYAMQAPKPGVSRDIAAQRGATVYSGPSQLSDKADVAGLMGDAGRIQTQAGALGSNAGRAALLRDKYGANTWGGSALDSALAGNGAAGGRLEAARGAYSRLAQQLGGAQADAAKYADKARRITEASAQQYRDIANAPPPAAPPPATPHTPRLPGQLDNPYSSNGSGYDSNASRVAEDKKERNYERGRGRRGGGN